MMKRLSKQQQQQQPKTILTRLNCCQETALAATKDPSGAEAVAGDVSTLGGTTKKH
jgi:hypothetical protein